MDDDLVTARELAVRWGKNYRHIAERYAADPSFPKAVWRGRTRVWPLAECEKWFRQKSGPGFRIVKETEEATSN